MRHFAFSITIILLLSAGIGCRRQTERDVLSPQSVITAIIDEGKDTRTTLGNPRDGVYYPLWKEEDEVAVFYESESYLKARKYTLLSGAGTDKATFMGQDEVGGLKVGLYPFSSIVADEFQYNALVIELSAIQHYSEGSFGNGAYPMFSASRSSVLIFKNLCSILHLSLTGTDAVESIRFVAHDSAMCVSGKGTVRIDFETEPELAMMAGGSSEVVLQCGGVYLNPDKPTDFFLVIPPGTYKGGFELEISSANGKEVRSIETDVTFSRSQYRSVPTFEFVPGTNPVAVPEAVDLGLSVKWASFNLGATKPEEFGDYYAWGETEPYYSSLNPLTWKEGKQAGYDWASYKWCMGSNTTLTKYCNNDAFGFNGYTDDKPRLDPEDDAATVILGGEWRMPAYEELEELDEKCTWEWTTQNGVNGYKITGPNSNSFFLPANGGFWDSIRFSGEMCMYWSSSLYLFWGTDPDFAHVIFGNEYYHDFDDDDGENELGRFRGYAIRPVYGPQTIKYDVESLTLNKTSLDLPVGEETTLVATALPEGAVNGSEYCISWSTSDKNVATVTWRGVVKGIGVGSAIITATSPEGKRATCEVTVLPNAAVPEAVDLGLSVKWASFNLGASKPEEVGDYFAWGEIEPYYSSQDPLIWKEGKEKGYDWFSYKWSMGSSDTMTKYCNDSEYGFYGFTDTKTVLDPEDDAAHVNLGSNWRIPTHDEWIDLMVNCTWTWITQNGVNGMLVIANNGNSIFLPAAGHWIKSSFSDAGSYGYYWSSSLYSEYPYTAKDTYFNSDSVYWCGYYRCFGFSVRSVYAE